MSHQGSLLDLSGIARREIFNKDSVLHERLKALLPEDSLGRKITDAVIHKLYQKDVIDLFTLMLDTEVSFSGIAELRRQDDRGKVGATLWNETDVKRMLAQNFTAILEYLGEAGKLAPQDRFVAQEVFQKIGPAYGVKSSISFGASVTEKIISPPPAEPEKKPAPKRVAKEKRVADISADPVVTTGKGPVVHVPIRKNSVGIQADAPFTRECILYEKLAAEHTSGIRKLLIEAGLGSATQPALLQKDMLDLARLLRAEKSFQLYPVLQGKLKSTDLSIVWDIQVVTAHYKGILGDLLGRLKMAGQLSGDEYREINELYKKFKPAVRTPSEFVLKFGAAAQDKRDEPVAEMGVIMPKFI